MRDHPQTMAMQQLQGTGAGQMTSHADYDYIEGLKARIVTLENALRAITAPGIDDGRRGWLVMREIARAAIDHSSPPKESERDIDAESLDASGSYWPNGRRPPDAIG